MKRLLGIMLAAALALASSAAQAQVELRERLLTVQGEGIVRASPDMALITLGVVSEGRSARNALTENSEAMTRIRDAVRAEGIEARDLQTSGFSLEPVYSQPPRDFDQSQQFVPEIVGYRVRNNLNARIRDLPRVGAILDTMVTLGANSISGPTFSVAEPQPLEDQARRAAVRDAIRKGELYATAAGIGLGSIFRIEEGYVSPPQPLPAQMFRMEAAAAPPVPIEGGELTFEAQVTVSWRLAD
jgi:uncharacterized protein YggE